MKLEAKTRLKAADQHFADRRIERANEFEKRWSAWLKTNSKVLKSKGATPTQLTGLQNLVKQQAKDISRSAVTKKIATFDAIVIQTLANAGLGTFSAP